MIEFIPMTEGEFMAYAAETVPSFAREKVAAGHWSEEESLRLSAEAFGKLLPEGLATADNFICRVRDASLSADVGILWYKVTTQAGRRTVFVCDISVHPDHRRKGYGALILSSLDSAARGLGASGIGLNVFGHNPAARALYEKAGFRATSLNMYRSLD